MNDDKDFEIVIDDSINVNWDMLIPTIGKQIEQWII
jgi:hypothetical protein